MPVGQDRSREGVMNAASGEAFPDYRILCDKLRVIIVNEVMVPNRPINGEGNGSQQEANEPFTTHPQSLSANEGGKTNQFDLLKGCLSPCKSPLRRQN